MLRGLMLEESVVDMDRVYCCSGTWTCQMVKLCSWEGSNVAAGGRLRAGGIRRTGRGCMVNYINTQTRSTPDSTIDEYMITLLLLEAQQTLLLLGSSLA